MGAHSSIQSGAGSARAAAQSAWASRQAPYRSIRVAAHLRRPGRLPSVSSGIGGQGARQARGGGAGIGLGNGAVEQAQSVSVKATASRRRAAGNVALKHVTALYLSHAAGCRAGCMLGIGRGTSFSCCTLCRIKLLLSCGTGFGAYALGHRAAEAVTAPAQ